MPRQHAAAFLRIVLLSACAFVLPVWCAVGGETSLKVSSIPKTAGKMKELMGDDYAYLEKDELLVVSDIDLKTLYQLMSRDFLIYMHVLKRDFYNKPPKARAGQAQAILTVFLFKDRESYVKGLRRIGMNVAEEDENNQGAVRNGYFYGGKERNFILINYRDNYEQGISTYAHEVSHALLGKEFPNAPAWINEGMATMVGYSKIVNSHLRYNGEDRVARIRRAVEKGEILPLAQLLRATGKEYSQKTGSNRYYDAGEQFCRFLHSRNQLLPVYRDLRDNPKKRETDEEIVQRITGLSLDNLEKAWHAWLRK